jgi:hypothetical protein
MGHHPVSTKTVKEEQQFKIIACRRWGKIWGKTPDRSIFDSPMLCSKTDDSKHSNEFLHFSRLEK